MMKLVVAAACGLLVARTAHAQAVGCADGNGVEYVADAIYGCRGAWNSGGITSTGAQALCAAGYAVCETQAELANLGLSLAICQNTAVGANEFFGSDESSHGGGDCFNDEPGNLGTNDIWGCGDTSNVNFVQATCGTLAGWTGNTDWGSWRGLPCAAGTCERTAVHKVSADNGGPLCCAQPVNCGPGTQGATCDPCPAGQVQPNAHAGDATCSACPAGTLANLGATACASCPLPPSMWLETEFAPELNVDASGFTIPNTKDRFRIVYDYHRKYFDVASSSGALSVTPGELSESIGEFQKSVPGSLSPFEQLCWDTYTVDVDWGVLVNECARSEEGTGLTGFIVYTCKIEIDGKETLDPIRNTALTREMHHELPFTVKFPKQVSASVSNLSAFQPVGVLAAVIRQAVTLDVSDPADVDAKIRLFTSVQWPFKLLSSYSVVNSQPTDIVVDSFVQDQDCADPNAGDIVNGSPGDANACSQTWLLDAQVDAALRCDIDGSYEVEFQAVCQPSFEGRTDCPLVQDDLGETDDIFKVTFVIDSEDFCVKVVDTVDLAASMAVYKDIAHTVPASNFIHSQTSYYVVSAVSNKVTIVSVEIDDIDVDILAGAHLDLATDGVIDATGVAVSLAIQDSGVNGNPAEAWFNFEVTSGEFPAPADGSVDFDVTAVVNVGFKDATGLVMLEKFSFNLLQAADKQQFAVTAKSGVANADDTDASDAQTVAVSVAAGSAMAVAALCV